MTTLFESNLINPTSMINKKPISIFDPAQVVKTSRETSVNSAFFKPGVVNIFSDASKTISSPNTIISVYVTYTDNKYKTQALNYDTIALEDVTVNEAEMYAIAYGLSMANDEYKEADHFNCFTDSMSSIRKIRRFFGSDNPNIPVDKSLKTFIDIFYESPMNSGYVYYFKTHSRNSSLMFKAFRDMNGLDINIYDLRLISAIMSFVHHLSNITSLTEYIMK